MAPPDDAQLEAQLAGGIALYDVSHLLPRHDTRIYLLRQTSEIVRQYHHHSGALGLPGFAGVLASAKWIIRATAQGGRNWPGIPYHYWLSLVPDYDAQGRLVVYRVQTDDVRSFHTGGKANQHGLGVVWQGNLSKRPPSAAQYEMAEALIPWLIEKHPAMVLPDCISWHAEAGRFGGKNKPSCPGIFVADWLQEYRSNSV